MPGKQNVDGIGALVIEWLTGHDYRVRVMELPLRIGWLSLSLWCRLHCFDDSWVCRGWTDLRPA